MRLVIQPDYDHLARWTASYIARKIELFRPTADRPFVLGLPTGSSPMGVYSELINLYKLGKVSFRHVITFNMDEYVGLAPDHPQSYQYFMWNNFFSHIDIYRENVNILNGMAHDIREECRSYEEKITAAGGIDLFLGGIGVDGHIAFNEPGSSLTSRTRDKELNYDTRVVNSRFFGNDVSRVPRLALTVGVGTIMDAREVLIIVNGHNKSRALRHVVECGVNHMWTASAIQLHQRAMVVCDEAATYELKVGTFKHFIDIEKDNLDIHSLWKSDLTW
jgi:glucosamine-6-phosphate deaminase